MPPKANLGDLRGLAGGLDGVRSSVMIDGGEFDGAKAYKDSKVCNMLTMQEMHRRFHEKTGITFASLYPGCIATTGLFREHYPLFRTLFPPFQKYITKGYVSEEESGKRLAQVLGITNLLPPCNLTEFLDVLIHHVCQFWYSVKSTWTCVHTVLILCPPFLLCQ